jgi:hypothetical protein
LSVPTRKQQTPAANTSLIGAILVAVLYLDAMNFLKYLVLQKLDLCQYEYWFLNLGVLYRCLDVVLFPKLIYYCILTFCETNSEWLKLSECTVASITKVWLALMYLDQFTPEIPLYKACSLVALKKNK